MKQGLKFLLFVAVFILLGSTKGLYAQDQPLPRVLVYLTGEEVDTPQSITEETISNMGFKIFDRNQIQNIKDVDEALSTNDKGKLLALKNRYGIEIIITGTAKKDGKEERKIYGRRYTYFKPYVAMKAIVSDTAEIIYSKSLRGPETARSNAMDKLTKDVANIMGEKIKEFWAKRANSQASFDVVISKMPYGQLSSFEEHLKGLSKVQGFSRRNYAKDTAFFEVNYRGSRNELEGDLTKCASPSLQIVRTTENRIELEVSSGGAVPTPVSQPPSISIVSPAPNAYFNTTSVMVEVRAHSRDGIDRVRINGVNAEKRGRHYFAQVALKEGSNMIRATARSSSRARAEAQISVNVDTIPPALTLDSPKEGETVTNTTLRVLGTVNDPNLLEVTVNGQKASLSADQRYYSEITLGSDCKITVVAKDMAGNMSTVERVLSTDNQPPHIWVRFPQENATFTSPTVQVMGMVSDASPVKAITINRQPVEFKEVTHKGRNIYQENFKTNPTYIYRFHGTITLHNGTNGIHVSAMDSYNNRAHVKVTVQADLLPAQVTLTTASSLVTTPEVLVQGTVNKPVSWVKVQGQTVTCQSGPNGITFSAYAQLQEGTNQIVAEAQDVGGRTVNASVQITLDSKGPELQILAPHQGAFLGGKIAVVGSCKDPNMSYVMVQGQKAHLRGEKFFSHISLPEGNQTITVQAYDSLGNTTSSAVTVVVDNTPPKISIQVPKQGATVSHKIVSVVGTVYDAHLQEVRVNGVIARVFKKSYHIKLTFAKDGNHKIVAVARDRAGNTAVAETEIKLDTTPPSVQFKVKVEGKVDTPGSKVWVNGQEVAVDANGNWQLEIDIMKIKELEIIAQDPNGNVSRQVRKLRD